MDDIDVIVLREKEYRRFRNTPFFVARDGECFTFARIGTSSGKMYNQFSFRKGDKKEDKKEIVLLHRAVWEAWVGPIPSGYHVHHKDHNKRHSGLDNLELLLAADHSRLHMTGEKGPNSTLSDEQAIQVLDLREEGLTYVELAEIFHVNYKTVGRICRGETYKHIMEKFRAGKEIEDVEHDAV